MRVRNIIFIVLFAIELIIILFLAIKKSKHNVKGYISLAITIIIMVCTVWEMLFPVIKTKVNASGSYKFERENITLVDESRVDIYAPDGRKRALQLALWYPKDYKETKKCPLVVFSHGSFGTVENNLTLMEELASRGYVVASIGHTYLAFTAEINGEKISMSSAFRNELISIQPNKDPEKSYPILEKWMDLTTKDASFVIDSIKSRNDGVFSLIDKDKICMMGYFLVHQLH